MLLRFVEINLQECDFFSSFTFTMGGHGLEF